MKNKQVDLITGIVLLLGSGGLAAYFRTLPEKSAMYPMAIVATTAFLSIVLIVQSLISKSKKSNKKAKLPSAADFKNVLIFTFFVVVYIIAVMYLGWVVSSFIYLAYYFYKVMGFKPIIFIVTLLSLVAIQVVFSRYLYIEMPLGIFESLFAA